MGKLDNKIAFVTGAATGIGRATAIALAKEGAKVMVTDINEEEANETLHQIKNDGGQAVFHHLDVSQPKAINNVLTKIFETEGAVDLAVNNAGIGGSLAPIHEAKLEDWHLMMTVNLTGVFLCMQKEIQLMLKKGSGRIVNISSLAGLNGMPMGAPYSAAKHGVLGLTKTAAMEYGKYNIRVNAVCPGFIETPILTDVPQKVLDYSTNLRVPLRRLGQPSEVAQTILWLLSEDSSYINGHSLCVDGGFKAN
ncbi:MAG: SDR family NAD(P)-dependent oxidoreductase [Bacteroidota bacterium]